MTRHGYFALIASLTISLVSACGDKDSADTGAAGPDDTGATEDDTGDTETGETGEPAFSWDEASTVCGQAVVQGSHQCEGLTEMGIYTILDGAAACDDDALFYDTGANPWQDWRDAEVATPAVDAEGRFEAALPDGQYAARHLYDCYGCTAFTSVEGECAEITVQLSEAISADAPNVYLYPEETSAIRVQVGQPGRLTISDPDYPRGGWWVLAEPDGLLRTAEGAHDYLFYEMMARPDDFQRESGWCVPGEHAQRSMEDALALYGFLEPEIDDFAEIWDPAFPAAGPLTVYPQTEDLPGLRIDPAPDVLVRLWFLVEPGCADVEPPEIQAVERTGYHAAEWGVMLDSALGRAELLVF